jgi:Tfp pilus assembly PilM family ATPase
MTTTANGSDVQLQEKETPSPKQNINVGGEDMNQPSTPTTSVAEEKATHGETSTTPTKSQESSFEQAFFFGLTIDDALKSTENLAELFYNACKYNHVELVKRCVDEIHININEPFNV